MNCVFCISVLCLGTGRENTKQPEIVQSVDGESARKHSENVGKGLDCLGHFPHWMEIHFEGSLLEIFFLLMPFLSTPFFLLISNSIYF